MKADVKVLVHSAIRLAVKSPARIIYFDPYGLNSAPHDADIIFSTHDHYDHLSPEDIARVAKADTLLVVPSSCRSKAEETGLKVVTADAGTRGQLLGVTYEAVPSYNTGKKFHPEDSGWLGYVVEADGERIYVAGDTDINPDNMKTVCDVALVPAGGTYTMTAAEAAALVNSIKPKTAIPTHYQYETGTLEDGEVFKQLVDDSIEVILQIGTRKKEG